MGREEAIARIKEELVHCLRDTAGEAFELADIYGEEPDTDGGLRSLGAAAIRIADLFDDKPGREIRTRVNGKVLSLLASRSDNPEEAFRQTEEIEKLIIAGHKVSEEENNG